jgi:hypothetical protein
MLRTNKKYRKIAEDILNINSDDKKKRRVAPRAAEKARINGSEADTPGKNDNNTGGVVNA